MGHVDNGFVGYYDPVTNANYGVATVDGQSFWATSGGPGAVGPMPDGLYSFGPGEKLAPTEETSMTDGVRPASAHRKFRFTGLGPRHSKGSWFSKRDWKEWWKGTPLIDDPAHPDAARWGILAHCNGGDPWTDGCLGYEDCAASQSAFESAYAKGNTLFTVRTTTKEEVDRIAQEKGLKPAPKPPEKKAESKANDSKIENGAEIIKGESTVLIGPAQREAAHLNSPHEKGGTIIEGKPDVLVGPQQLPMSGVGHATTDPSKVGTGDQSVLLGP